MWNSPPAASPILQPIAQKGVRFLNDGSGPWQPGHYEDHSVIVYESIINCYG